MAADCQSENVIADAGASKKFSFEGLRRLLASAVGNRVRLVHTPASLGLALTRPVGSLLRDVVPTRDEVGGLMAGLLTSRAACRDTSAGRLQACGIISPSVLFAS